MIVDDRKRVIGKVISVAADRFVVEMSAATDNFTVVGYDDIHYVAQLGAFIIVPVQADYVVGEIIGLREKEASKGGGNLSETTELDKASSAKFLDVVPVGTLPQQRDEPFRFGVSNFPSLYADALYILDDELDRVFQVKNAEEPTDTDDSASPTRLTALPIGRSVIFQGYDLKVKINEFFGGHVAVLGNTGSGKSCTVATILQALYEKKNDHAALGSTFIVFDVNGEYSQAFSDLSVGEKIGVRYIVADGTDDRDKFQLPHWFLNFDEWELLLRASERTQQPVLRMALGLSGLLTGDATERKRIKQHFVATCVTQCFRGADGDSPVAQIRRVFSILDKYQTDELNSNLLRKYGCNEKFGNFAPPSKQQEFLEIIKKFILDEVTLPNYKNRPFKFSDLEDCLEFAILYDEAHGNRQIRDYCSQMLTRLKALSDRENFAFLRHDDVVGQTIADFLSNLLGLQETAKGYAKKNQIIVIDMNDVDDEVVEVVTAVISRMIFNLLRKADPRNRFPVNLVLEEAHRYVAEKPSLHAIDASRIFERIAKEGRKYGMFLTVASQRPSELSKTVLSQCSNFVVHRIQNPDDLSHIRQMTPFISDSVLKRLPSLPKQHALIFGNAVNIPTTFRVRDVNPAPKSDDAQISELWYRPENFVTDLALPVEADTHPSPAAEPVVAEHDFSPFENGGDADDKF